MTPVEQQASEQQVEQQALAVASEAKAIVKIATPEQYNTVCVIGRNVAGRINAVSEFFEPMRKATYDAYQSVITKKKSILDPLEAAKKHCSALIGTFEAEQEEKRQAEQRRLEAEEKKRREDEQLNLAVHLESQGQTEAAEQVLAEEPMVTAPVTVQREVPRAQGVSGREQFYAEIEGYTQGGAEMPAPTSTVNFKKLVEAVAAGKVPLNALEPNLSFLHNQARAMKAMLSYPGVTVKKRNTAAFRQTR